MRKTAVQETKKKSPKFELWHPFYAPPPIYYRYIVYTFTNTSHVHMTFKYIQLAVTVY